MFSKVQNDLNNEVFLNKLNLILNKLSLENVETIISDFEELSIDSEKRLTSCVELVFKKAVDEPASTVACAHICKRMEMKTVVIGGKEVAHFRKLLISRCQREFDKLCMVDLDQDQNVKTSNEENSEDLRSLATITLIAELYKLKVLTAIVMHICLKRLLDKADDQSLECLCHLLTEIGQILEIETSHLLQEGKVRPNSSIEDLDKYFNEMKKVMKNKNISHRIRLLIREVLDLRVDSWRKGEEDDRQFSGRMADQILGGDVYDAQEILKERRNNGKQEYLIKWKGWSLSDSTWEPVDNLLDERLLQEFKLKQQQTNFEEFHSTSTNISSKKPSETKTATMSDDLELPVVLPKSVIGSRNFWHQHSVTDIFNLKYKGNITDIQMIDALSAPKDHILSRYNQYIKEQDKIEMLKQIDTYSAPRLKTACDFKESIINFLSYSIFSLT